MLNEAKASFARTLVRARKEVYFFEPTFASFGNSVGDEAKASSSHILLKARYVLDKFFNINIMVNSTSRAHKKLYARKRSN